MKTLTLVCLDCNARKVFRGSTTDEIMNAIDVSGWSDRPIPKRGPGEMSAHCDRCVKECIKDH